MGFNTITLRVKTDRGDWMRGNFKILTVILLLMLTIFFSPMFICAETQEMPGDFYENIFSQHGAIMLMIDPDNGEIVFANRAASNYYGYPVDTLQTMLISQINTLTPAAILEEMTLAESENRNYFLFKHQLANGQIRDVEVYSYPVDAGDRTLLFSVITDITDELAAETQISRIREQRLLALIFITIVFLSGFIIMVLTNRQRKKAIEDLRYLNQLQRIVADISLKFFASKPDDLERLFSEAMDTCGPIFDIDRSIIYRISDDQSNFDKLFSWYRPGIPERKDKIQMGLEEMPWTASQLLDRHMVCIEDVCLMPSETSEEQSALLSQGVHGRCVLPLVIGEKVVAIWMLDSFEKPMNCQQTNRSIRDVLAGIFAAALDRNQSHQQQQFWQNMLGYIIENDPSSIVIMDNQMNYMYASKKYLKDFRIRETNILGMNHYKVFPNMPELFKDVHRKVLAGEVINSEEEIFHHADGSTDFTRYLLRPWYQLNGQIGGIVMYLEVITERKRQEQKRIEELSQYRQQQKLESIGTLASGVAHEINNPIMGIINYAQLIFDENQNATINSFAREIITEGLRISSITSDLLFYSRQQKQEHSLANINDIILRTLNLINSVLKKDKIEIHLNLLEDLPQLKCRSQQIQQIMMNLITNARDALNDKYPNSDPDKMIHISNCLFHEGGRRWIRVTVEDHGTGIPLEIQDKLFDPFFTTKPREVGTGLGLPISYGIAKDHHGRLVFETETGLLTRFILELPIDNGWNHEEN